MLWNELFFGQVVLAGGAVHQAAEVGHIPDLFSVFLSCLMQIRLAFPAPPRETLI